jgi:hypothetical protein
LRHEILITSGFRGENRNGSRTSDEDDGIDDATKKEIVLFGESEKERAVSARDAGSDRAGDVLVRWDFGKGKRGESYSRARRERCGGVFSQAPKLCEQVVALADDAGVDFYRSVLFATVRNTRAGKNGRDGVRFREEVRHQPTVVYLCETDDVTRGVRVLLHLLRIDERFFCRHVMARVLGYTKHVDEHRVHVFLGTNYASSH